MKNLILTAVLLFMTFTLIVGLEYSFSEADSLNIPYGYDEVLYDRISQEEVHFFKWGIESQILTVKH
ncbi:MAG: hypothetical protein B6226_03465 [Candidatus Cloacimonetes bacterium 4572_65]|nr:MAG: hypothetical protein B6226_03465 [Candidatus Cloacimonetes bacterium 4572_65]